MPIIVGLHIDFSQYAIHVLSVNVFLNVYIIINAGLNLSAMAWNIYSSSCVKHFIKKRPIQTSFFPSNHV